MSSRPMGLPQSESVEWRRAKELSWYHGTSRSCWLADLRRCWDVTVESGMQKSVRY